MKQLLILVCFVFLITSCKKQEINPEENQKYSYEEVPNDPTGLRLYTLENGLKVYLSKNTNEPKIQTFVTVKAGSNYDPKRSTGLAHYLEHMLFKGTDEIGTKDWQKEKEQLDKIAALYEAHKNEEDPEKKKEIYSKIDSISLAASNFSIANEYDKIMSSLGAEGTNAHTWVEETVYQNKIPSVELEKWLKIESERFSQVVLRLFHTELEAVYEEFNQGQDNDWRKSYEAMLKGLFPNHPYGQQSTIGLASHLKNPSMKDIHEYFNTYYVPNNMAIVLVGDLDFDKTIAMVDQYFGAYEQKEVTHPNLPKEEPITTPIVKEVYGPSAEMVTLAYRSGAMGSKDEKMLTLINGILSNNVAGLIDLDLVQKQLVMECGSNATFLNDYGYQEFYGVPNEGQTLETVKDLVLAEIEKLKKGEFEDWMLEAVISRLKLDQLRNNQKSTGLATTYYNAFIHNQSWASRVQFIEELKKITKEDIVAFANEFYKENYVVVYKRFGQDKSIVKVENPKITPVNLNRGEESQYIKDLANFKSEAESPVFVDFKKEIKETTLANGIKFEYIENKENDLFDLNIIFDMGSDHNKKLNLAVGYLDFLGTDKYSPEDVKKEFFKIGVDYWVSTGHDQTVVTLRGLKENFDRGIELLSHVWDNAKADPLSYQKYVEKIAKERYDNMMSKGRILRSGLRSYGTYGENSRLRDIYQMEELMAINPNELVALIKEFKNYEQHIFYYGKDVDKVQAALNTNHKVAKERKAYPEKTTYTPIETGGNVYFVNYDMVQTEMLFLAKADNFNAKDLAQIDLFNTYFGGGLSSIVFQEIRESKSLAYSAYANYASAREANEPNYVMAYIGTQANKVPQAVDAILALLNDMPEAKEQFEAAKKATLKKIAAERITKASIYWEYLRLKKLGLSEDPRKEIYKAVENMTLADIKAFFERCVKGRSYNIMVVGNKNEVDMNALKKLGTIKELDVNYLFNYKFDMPAMQGEEAF